ncbi:MAG TPA: T9SS type A sorting domain-containing protein [Cytophagaceae bacterium]|jgi:hypothetical protein
MKRLLSLITGLALAYTINAQTKPIIGEISKSKVNINSGADFVIVSGLSDGDAAAVQNLTITALSSNPSILEVSSVDYVAGNSYAIIRVTEKAKAGTATITVQAADADGPANKVFNMEVGQFLTKGINWSVYDIIFYEKVIPLTERSVFDSLVTEINVPIDEEIYNRLPLKVGPTSGWPKHDFFTSMFKGFLAPPATGAYTFTLNAADQSNLWLSTDENFANAKKLIDGNTGTATVNLQAGKYYAIYAVNWTIHTLGMTVQWEGPEVAKAIVNSNYLFPSVDLQKPTIPLNPALTFRGITSARLKWQKSTDIQRLKGYNIYSNGVKVGTTTDTTFTMSALTASTSYSVFVTSIDVTGNESFPSTRVAFNTYGPDNIKPTAPTQIVAKLISDVSTRISWSGAKDNETEVAGYNVYLDNKLFNTSGLITDTTVILKVLAPLTSYNVQVEAVDAGNNVSSKSATFTFKTIKFDPIVSSPGIKKARASFTTQAISRNEGFGITDTDDKIENIPAPQRKLLDEFKPGVQRWGDLGKNARSFSDYSGTGVRASDGKAKTETYGGFLKRCNDMNTYCAMVIGVRNDTDWMKDSTTFTKFMEYLNGPSTSTQGKRRADEGYREPLLAKSRGLIIDLGTEVWGGAGLHNAEIGADYAVYAKWARRMALLIKASPYYDKSKVFITYSGRDPDPLDSYGLNDKLIRGDKGEVDWMSVSGYLGGNMNYSPLAPAGASELEYYKTGISRMAHNLVGSQLQLKNDKLLAKRYLPKNFYESNMTTSNYNGRLGQAIIMTDYMLSVQEWGTTLPSIFHLTAGQWRITEPAENFKKLPLFYTSSLINRLTIGNMLDTEVKSADKIYDDKGKEVVLEPVGFNVFTENGKYAMVLTSRDFENDYQVQLNLPDGVLSGSTARKYFVTGTDFNTLDAIIDSSNVTLTDSMLITVPKYSMVLLTFNGTDLKQTPLPIGSTAFGTPLAISEEEMESEAGVLMYPNPTRNDLNIQSNLGLINHVKVTGLLGETVYEESSSSSNLMISMENLPKGIYLIQVDTQGKTIRKKVIKN